jgi:GNAT superfamily N-acetyltransferase
MAHVLSWRAAYAGQLPDDYLARLSVDRREAAWTEIIGDSQWPSSGTLVLVEEDEVLGFANIGPSRDDRATRETGEVRAIYLVPEVWGRGAGRLLMGEAVRFLRSAGFTESILWVLDSNSRARRFYEVGGWLADGAERVTNSRGFDVKELRYRLHLL